MSNLFECWVPGDPIAKQSARHRVQNGCVRSYTAPHQVTWEQWCRGNFVDKWKGQEPLDEPLLLVATFWLDKPKSAKKRNFPVVKPDLTNLVKPVEDALELAKVVLDDKVICGHKTDKRYRIEPAQAGVMVALRRMT